MRGKAFGFLVLLGATWTTARILIIGADDPAVHSRAQPKVASRTVTPTRKVWPEPMPMRRRSLINTPRIALVGGPPQISPPLPKRPLAERHPPDLVAQARGQTAKSPDNLAISDSVLSFAPAPPANAGPRAVEFYAYRFWRSGQGARGQLGLGQYGGSQSAVLVAVPLDWISGINGVPRFALTARVSASHGPLRERELAAGLRWRPLVSFPAQISVERRFRENRPDAIAAFVSGGTDGASLPLGFVLDGYGQAGFVSGEGGGGFADIQVQAQRPILSEQPAKIKAGVGLWGGGQDRLLRVEIGPSVRAILPTDGAQFRLDASWRFQIAGNLRPDDGPAITLSTSF